MPWLSSGDKQFELPQGEAVVGGGAMADWRLHGFDLMPRHFVISTRNDAVTVRPYGTDDVVALNGRQVGAEPCRLRDGDVVAAGTGRFRFSSAEPTPGDDVQDAPAPAAYLVDSRHAIAYALTRVSTGIGRDPSNIILLQDPTASRFHAEVRREAGGFALHGMGSSGTKLNGSRVGAPLLLEEGDEVEIAYIALRFTQLPLPDDIEVSTHGGTAVDEVATRPTITEQRERVSLPDAKAERVPVALRAPVLPWVIVGLLALVLVGLLLLR